LRLKRWLFVAWLACGAREGAAQSAQARKLAGLPATVHVVVSVDSAAQAAGISEDTLHAYLKSGLENAGFTVTRLFGGSYLMIEVHAFQVSTTAMLVYDVGLEYHTFVVPARRLSALLDMHRGEKQVPSAELEQATVGSVDAPLYRRAVYGVGARDQAKAVTGVVKRNLQVFINDFRSVNPSGK
jgi:hypothetical protein